MPDPRDKREVVSGHPELFSFRKKKNAGERLPATGLQKDPVKLLNEKINDVSQERSFLVPCFAFKPHASDGKESG